MRLLSTRPSRPSTRRCSGPASTCWSPYGSGDHGPRERGRRRGPTGVAMKLSFVTPRYGTEVIGGAETAARMLAERLCLRPDWEVEVLTSCAMDHLTWENTVPEGTSTVNGVTVRRFPTSSRRQL